MTIVSPPDELLIRPARPDEAAALSDLARRSKAHWGYDAAFLAACRDDLTLTPGQIARDAVYVVAAGDGPPQGFYQLTGAGTEPMLNALFVTPDAIGRGLGRRLWAHAVALAAGRGARGLTLQSDPHAAGFYRAMGARLVGETPSTVFPGRMLPTFRVTLPPPGESATCDAPRCDPDRPAG
jgi:GNAT superfamily N-acetyltransferase